MALDFDKTASRRLIENLSNANGVSGFEDEVVVLATQAVEPYAETEEDAMRNLYIARKGNTGIKPVLQLDAHSDEVGYMIRAIKPNGMLVFVTVGGQAEITLPAHKVRIRNSEGDYIPGIISSIPPHFMTAADRNTIPKVPDLVIDIGATSAQEVAEDFKIEVGAPAVPDVECEELEDQGVLLGKAFDNRIGTALLLDTFKALQGAALDVDVIGSLSAQEEVGERGATVAVRKIQPDIAIVFEGAPADDTVMPEYLIQTGMHRGAMLRDFDSTIITNPRFQKFALDTAKKSQIKVQRSVRTGGGQDGAIISLYQGVPTIVISVPVRFAHTPYCYVALDDYEAALRLATTIIPKLSNEVIGTF